MSSYILSAHALRRLSERGITPELIDQVVTNPDAIHSDGPDRFVCQGKVTIRGKDWLLRVAIATDVEPSVISTVYLTTLGRYGS